MCFVKIKNLNILCVICKYLISWLIFPSSKVDHINTTLNKYIYKCQEMNTYTN